MSTSPAAGSGVGTSSTFNESIGPHARQITARIAFLPVRLRSRRWSITQRVSPIERAGCARRRTLLLWPLRFGPSTVAQSTERSVTPARLAVRCILGASLALLALSIVLAGVPPALDEDRSEPGYCSPDCPLQQDATHSIAVATTVAPRGLLVEASRETLTAVATPARPAVPASPDASRAPPLA